MVLKSQTAQNYSLKIENSFFPDTVLERRNSKRVALKRVLVIFTLRLYLSGASVNETDMIGCD